MKLFHFDTILLSAILLVSGFTAYAQSTYKLEQSGSGHYFITADVCGTSSKVMLESAIPAFLIDNDFYERNMKGCGLRFESSKAKIRLMNKTYNVLLRAEGAISIGNASYEGPIWILEDFDDLRVPVQFLKSADNGRAAVTVSLKEGWMSIGDYVRGRNGTGFKLGVDQSTGCPAVKAEVRLTSANGESSLKGFLNIDFGNPMLLALEGTHKGFSKALRSGRIAVNDALDANGNVVAQGIYAEELSLLNRDYAGESVIIHPGWGDKKILGLLGLPFFEDTVTLDFDRHMMIVE